MPFHDASPGADQLHHPALFENVWVESGNENTASPYYLFPLSLSIQPIVRQQMYFSDGFAFLQYGRVYDPDGDSVNLCGTLRYRRETHTRTWQGKDAPETSQYLWDTILDYEFNAETGARTATAPVVKKPMDLYSQSQVWGTYGVRTISANQQVADKPEDLEDGAGYWTGGIALTEQVTPHWLKQKVEQWQATLRALWTTSSQASNGPNDTYLTITGLPASQSEHVTGFTLFVSGLLLWKRTDIHIDDPGLDPPSSTIGYKQPFRLMFEEVERVNQPVVWSESETRSRSASGFNAYNHGSVIATLENPITAKKWRDSQGTFDPADTDALDIAGWLPDWQPVDFIPYHSRGYAARGMCVSATGATYRVTFEAGYTAQPADVWHTHATHEVTVTPTATGILNVTPTSSRGEDLESGWQVWSLRINKTERQEGVAWVEITAEDPWTQVAGSPAPGILVVLCLQARRGRRWGFKPGLDVNAYGVFEAYEVFGNFLETDLEPRYANKRIRHNLEARAEQG